MKPLMELAPTGTTLEIFDDRVTLTPKGIGGFLTKGTTAQKDIPFSSISAVEFKKGGFLAGYIQFTIKGGIENTGWVGDATYDENSVTFGGALDGGERYNEAAQEIVEFVREKISVTRPNEANSSESLADEVAKLSKLHADGVLSAEEFAAAKQRLLR